MIAEFPDTNQNEQIEITGGPTPTGHIVLWGKLPPRARPGDRFWVYVEQFAYRYQVMPSGKATGPGAEWLPLCLIWVGQKAYPRELVNQADLAEAAEKTAAAARLAEAAEASYPEEKNRV